MAQLKEKYKKEVIPVLKEKFNYSSIMEVPKIEKVILNVGVSEAVIDRKFVDEAMKDIEKIAGQKPVKTKAKKSINQFKVRQGQELGVKVTLRKERMWEFLYKFINVALPRIRDFKGIAVKGFDGKGNFTLGIKEHTIFPEIEFESTEKIRGLSITIVTTAKTDAECKELLATLGVPFRR
ncbi:MAG: 50S ribosomal protein L5 [Spirochaetales bacterium]|jgi:large subunit ribosomal protein L5|nr:50S ribosomal protein L5 [Exilispira sp.]NMC67562.1 50S ribosomal protein L5 [Spirochaetales bacterium]